MLLVPAARAGVRRRRHRRRGRRPRPPARRRPRGRAPGPAPRRRRRRADDARRPAVRRGRGAPRPDVPVDGTHPQPRARVPRRGRGDPRAARRRRPHRRRSCAASPSPARWPTPAATRPTCTYEQKVELLQTLDVTERLELALGFQRERLAELQVRKRIRDDVESGAEKQQREYFLRKQMESIRKELGEDDASVVEEYRTKIEEAGMPEHVREQAEKELGRLERMGEQSRRVERDPHLPRLADRGAVEQALRGAARSRSTRARCSTPTTPASRTSRTGSSSTSRSRSCASSAGSPRTSAPARS